MYDVEDIKKILPHRDPFLFIDIITEIIEIDDTVTVKAQKFVKVDEPFFRGHFPTYPVMPGVLILEALAQTGAFYVLSMKEYLGKIAFFTGAQNVKWKKQVLPGDTLNLEVSLIGGIRHGIGKGIARATVLDELVCQAEISFAIR